MTSLRLAGVLFAAGVIAFLIAFFAGRLPFTPNPDGMSAVETSVQPVLHEQSYNPELLVPESTMSRNLAGWSDNPVATIPESTMGQSSSQDVVRADEMIGVVPESTMGKTQRQYNPNWDDNPVATIPESTMGQESLITFNDQ